MFLTTKKNWLKNVLVSYKASDVKRNCYAAQIAIKARFSSQFLFQLNWRQTFISTISDKVKIALHINFIRASELPLYSLRDDSMHVCFYDAKLFWNCLKIPPTCQKFLPILRTCISAITWKRWWRIVRLSHTSLRRQRQFTQKSKLFINPLIKNFCKMRLEQSGFQHVFKKSFLQKWESLSSRNVFKFHLTPTSRST